MCYNNFYDYFGIYPEKEDPPPPHPTIPKKIAKCTCRAEYDSQALFVKRNVFYFFIDLFLKMEKNCINFFDTCIVCRPISLLKTLDG